MRTRHLAVTQGQRSRKEQTLPFIDLCFGMFMHKSAHFLRMATETIVMAGCGRKSSHGK